MARCQLSAFSNLTGALVSKEGLLSRLRCSPKGVVTTFHVLVRESALKHLGMSGVKLIQLVGKESND